MVLVQMVFVSRCLKLNADEDDHFDLSEVISNVTSDSVVKCY